MFLSSLIEELCTKEENNKVDCTLTFGGECIHRTQYLYNLLINPYKTAYFCYIFMLKKIFLSVFSIFSHLINKYESYSNTSKSI